MVAKERGGRPPRSTRAGSGRAPTSAPALLAREPGDRLSGSPASWPPARSAPPAWPRRGSTPATSPTASASSSRPTDRLWHIARLAWRTIPYAFQRAGPSRPARWPSASTAPSGAAWSFGDDDAPTVITGSGHELCQVAGQRAIRRRHRLDRRRAPTPPRSSTSSAPSPSPDVCGASASRCGRCGCTDVGELRRGGLGSPRAWRSSP